MVKILFFEDSPYASENRLFRTVLRKQLEKLCLVQISEEKAVSKFEEAIYREKYDIVILDIMAATTRPLYWEGTKEVVPDSLIGVELLRRCRLGNYGEHYKNANVYIRTARGEPHVRRLCEREGASGFFKAGVDDDKLINKIEEEVKSFISSPNVKFK